MGDNSFESIKFNYYLSSPSYIKTILGLISDEKVSIKKKGLIIEISNYILNSLNKNEITEYIRLSRFIIKDLNYYLIKKL